MKNDITYEYRVFTNRLIDVEAMEVGKCTSKVVKELKAKDKVNGRFFHTSDTDEWFFCWNGELQKLNLKGDSDVNAALAEVEKLIADANAAVSEAKATAKDAKEAAADAKVAADSATEAVKNIDNKADKADVDALISEVATKADTADVEKLVENIAKKADVESVETLSQSVEAKADKSELAAKADVSDVQKLSNDIENKADATIVNELSQTVETKANASDVQKLADKVDGIKLDDYALKSEIEGLATETFVNAEIAKIEIPTKVSKLENDANYLTKSEADATYAKIGSGSGSEGVDLSDYVTKEELENKGYLTEHQDITGKQDVIEDLDSIRSLANSALQEVPAEYVTDTELTDKGYLTAQSLEGLATKTFVNEEIAKIDIPEIPTNISAFVNDANYLTEHQDITGKQDLISDLEEIRANAALGAKALQAVPEEYVTDTELTAKGYLTAQSIEGYALKSEIPSMENYYSKEEIDDKLDAINSLLGEALTITNTILA